jgi:hypothetical protein
VARQRTFTLIRREAMGTGEDPAAVRRGYLWRDKEVKAKALPPPRLAMKREGFKAWLAAR